MYALFIEKKHIILYIPHHAPTFTCLLLCLKSVKKNLSYYFDHWYIPVKNPSWFILKIIRSSSLLTLVGFLNFVVCKKMLFYKWLICLPFEEYPRITSSHSRIGFLLFWRLFGHTCPRDRTLRVFSKIRWLLGMFPICQSGLSF